MNETKEIRLIKDNPRKAIWKLSLPITFSLLFLMLNNLIDCAWVSGLGGNALAAVGFVTPLYLAIVGLGSGLGAGINSAISRAIGSEDNERANNTAWHGIILSIFCTILLTIILYFALNEILATMGAGEVMEFAKDYGEIMVLGTFALLFPSILGAILRSEGQIKKATYPLIACSVMNMVIDPIVIYTLNMGITGAALCTIFCELVCVIIMAYWLFIERDTYFDLHLSKFKNTLKIYKDILIVGIPASLEEIIMAILSAILNATLVVVGGTVSVAVFSATWRLISIAVTPAVGVGIAAITVIATAYGAKDWKKLKIAFNSSFEISMIFATVVFVIFFIFAEDLSGLFTYYDNGLSDAITMAIRILGIYIIAMPAGLISAYYFQSIGKGFTSLALTIIREFIFIVIMVYILTFVFNLGVYGTYWGIILGGIFGSLVSYICAKYSQKKLRVNCDS